MKFSNQPYFQPRFGDWLSLNFANKSWNRFQCAVAFSQRSGVRHLAGPLRDFASRATVEMILGIGSHGTSYEALRMILDILGDNGKAWIFHNEAGHSFHPKVYVLSNEERASVAIGSNNLTRGGLFTNYEGSILLDLDLSTDAEMKFYQDLQEMFLSYRSRPQTVCRPLTSTLVEELLDKSYIVKEVESRRHGESTRRRSHSERMFDSEPIAVPPPVEGAESAGSNTVLEGVTGFVMTLHKTDVGAGQVTPGTSRRSPEIFLPVIAVRDVAPQFWGWPDLFIPDPNKPDKRDRKIAVRLAGETVMATIWRNPDKNDFRLRAEAIRTAGNIGDLLRVERAPEEADYDYYIEIIPEGTALYEDFSSLCDQSVSAKKRFGYYA